MAESDPEPLSDPARASGSSAAREHAAGSASDEAGRYRALFEGMEDGFCVIRFIDGPHGPLSDYVHIMANDAYERNAGFPVVGKRLREIVGAEAEDWLAFYLKVLETGEPIRFERELEATGRWLDLSAFRLGPRAANEVAVLFKDTTARHRAELALTELNQTLESRVVEGVRERQLLAEIVESTDAYLHVLDSDGRWLGMNSAAADEFERLAGVRPEIGKRLVDAVAGRPELAEPIARSWARALAGDEFVETIEVDDGAAGTRWYEMRFYTLRDAEGAPAGAYQFAYDVTARVRGQQRLREAEEALRQAQKMEAVGQLTGGLAHDFNNLLAGISGAFEMIEMRLAQGRGGDVERYLTAGRGATRRAAALTHRLLAFSRRQTLTPAAIDINRLMTDMIELVRRTVGPAITVETVAASGLWTSLADANQLENAVLNLCINARDAMPEGGTITIETGNRWLDQRAADEQGLEPGQYVSICVSDTGTGIDKDTLERVFEPFFTTKPQGEGTGLGLSMVYGFARQSNGHVRIYSEVGQGTMVCVYLPRHLGEAEAEERASEAPVAGSAAGETVLVVDDEPTVRMLIVDALADRGYGCIEAADGPAGLRVLEAGADIDLLITDVGLPGGMNGRQVATEARRLRPGLKTLFITGYAENAVLNHGHIERGMEVLTKPFAVDELARRVERLLREG